MIRGCDVSVCQGLVPWQPVKDSGVKFAGLRCSIGNEVLADTKFVVNAEACLDLGIAPFPYHFAYPLPHLDARAQAQHAFELSQVRGHALGSATGELPPALDLEWPPRETKLKDGTIENTWAKWGCSASQIAEWGLTYLDEATKLWGVKPSCYSYPYFLACIQVQKYSDYGNYLLWLAAYGAQGRIPADTERPKVPAPFDATKPLLWQHDGNGGLKLPNGVDADFNVFTGTQDEFNALLGLPRAPDPAIDWVTVQSSTAGLMVDDAIADYRQSRQNEEDA